MSEVVAEYGLLKVLDGFQLSVSPGELVAVVGHNGAGKTTALRVIAGLKRQRLGRVRINGQTVDRLGAAGRARLGLAMVPEGVSGLFPTLTVRQNLEAIHVYAGHDGSAAHWDRIGKQLKDAFSEVLVDRLDQVAGSMSGGQRQMLAISLALIRHPSVLLLDEPSTGLAPVVVKRIFAVIQSVAQATNTAVVLAEQNLAAALEIATRIVVVQSGRPVAAFSRAEFPAATEVWRYF